MDSGNWYVLFQLTDSQVKITIRAILFNIFQPHVTTRFNELLILLVNLMKYCIWITRNEAKHESKNVTTIGIKAFFIRTLSSRIRADFVRFDSDSLSLSLSSQVALSALL